MTPLLSPDFEDTMDARDIHDNVKISVALETQLIDSDTNTDGEIIDVQGFGSLEFAVTAGDITDGDFAVTLYHGDSDTLSDAALVTSADLLGDAPAFDDGDGQTVQKLGYKGSKRYVRARVASTSTTDGGTFGALAIQGAARNAPVS